jgi:hypothetical protein
MQQPEESGQHAVQECTVTLQVFVTMWIVVQGLVIVNFHFPFAQKALSQIVQRIG